MINYLHEIQNLRDTEVEISGKFFSFSLSTRKIAFIDGGNNFIVQTPSFSLALLRVACVIYDENTKIKSLQKEEFCLITPTYTKIGKKKYGVLDVEKARLLYEREFIAKIINELPEHSVVVRDGPLDYHSEKVTVVGLVKTNRVLRNGANFITALAKKAPQGRWYYKEMNHYFACLDPKSKHIFRLEFSRVDLSALGAIARNSGDPMFKGYPYGLIKADKIANVTDEEVMRLRIRLFSKIDIRKDLSTLDAHDYLDSINKGFERFIY